MTISSVITQSIKENLLHTDLFPPTDDTEFSKKIDIEHNLVAEIVFTHHLNQIAVYITDEYNVFRLRVWSDFSFGDDQPKFRSSDIAKPHLAVANEIPNIPYYSYQGNGLTDSMKEAFELRDYINQLERELVEFFISIKDEHLDKHITRWNENEKAMDELREQRRAEREKKISEEAKSNKPLFVKDLFGNDIEVTDLEAAIQKSEGSLTSYELHPFKLKDGIRHPVDDGSLEPCTDREYHEDLLKKLKSL
ncbi:hypothetical protein KW882_01350 [Vibrio parahaemolyticus]